LKKVRDVIVAVCVFAAQGIVKDNVYGHVECYVFWVWLNIDEVALNGRAVI
jgi:hypothetical protein